MIRVDEVYNKYRETYKGVFHPSWLNSFHEYLLMKQVPINEAYAYIYEYQGTLHGTTRYEVGKFLRNFYTHVAEEEGWELPEEHHCTVINKKNAEQVIQHFKEVLG